MSPKGRYLQRCDSDGLLVMMELDWHSRIGLNSFEMLGLDKTESDTLGHSFLGTHATSREDFVPDY